MRQQLRRHELRRDRARLWWPTEPIDIQIIDAIPAALPQLSDTERVGEPPGGDPMTTPTPVLILGREPAVLAELVASILVAVNLFLLPDFDSVLQGAINAVVVALASIYVAVKVRDENLLPILLGGFKVLVALFVAFGVDWNDQQQAAALGVASLVAGLFVRQQATAPVDRAGEPAYGRHAA